MKTPIKHRMFILVIALFPLWGLGGLSCSKDDNTPAIEKLPKATQKGAGTFGCLVDGKAFVHNDGIINCFYQYVDGGYYFGISGNNYDYQEVVSVFLGTQKKIITEGQTYSLFDREIGNAFGGGGVRTSSTNSQTMTTNNQYTGKLTITKLDTVQYIVSGTFWFDLKHPITGDTVKVRQGRFDSHFGS